MLYLPWLPTLLYQVSHTGSPWDSAPDFGAPVQISRNLLGGDRATLAARSGHRGRPGRAVLPPALAQPRVADHVDADLRCRSGTLAFGWIVSHFSPAWAYRYFAPILGSLLLLAALGLARARGVGIIALLLVVFFWANPAEFTPQYKSDMRDVAAEMGPRLHRGDLVILGQPEQVPLAWYYLPAGLRFANTSVSQPIRDVESMNWVHALPRLQNADPSTDAADADCYSQAQSAGPLRAAPDRGRAELAGPVDRARTSTLGPVGGAARLRPELKPVAWAPHNYRGACCVADSALALPKTLRTHP